MPDVFTLPTSLSPPPVLPLQGLTLLGVEDSRFASDALRLMCQRSGARLRRADSLLAAQAHLRVYRPDVILIDLGLPDGRGEGLIRQLAQTGPVVLGMSGDCTGRDGALAAGAAGFLDKPLASLAQFQASILAHLPDRFLHQPGPDGGVVPDPMALRDDLARAARLVASLQTTGPDAPQRRYLAGFLSGIAISAQDSDLAEAALHTADGAGLARLAGLLRHRIAAGAAL